MAISQIDCFTYIQTERIHSCLIAGPAFGKGNSSTLFSVESRELFDEPRINFPFYWYKNACSKSRIKFQVTIHHLVM